MTIKYLVLGPSAMGYFALLGGLSDINLSQLEEVSGSSAGAILGLFLCLGKSIQEIIEFSLDLDLKELTKINLRSVMTKFGLIKHDPIKEKLIQFCGEPKFRDLPKKLYVTAFCVNKSETEYFSIDTTPDMSVIDAISMSISVPFLFESVNYRGLTYVDGGTTEALPTLSFLNKNPDEVLALQLETETQSIDEIKTVREFVFKFSMGLIKNTESFNRFKTIKINVGAVNIFNFLMELEDKLKLFYVGRGQTGVGM